MKEKDNLQGKNFKETGKILLFLMILTLIFIGCLGITYNKKINNLESEEIKYLNSNQYAMKITNQVDKVLYYQLLKGYLFDEKKYGYSPNAFYVNIKDKTGKEIYTNIPLLEKETYTNIPLLEKETVGKNKENLLNMKITIDKNLTLSKISENKKTIGNNYEDLIKNTVINSLNNSKANSQEDILKVYNFTKELGEDNKTVIYKSPTGYSFDNNGNMLSKGKINPYLSQEEKDYKENQIKQAKNDMEILIKALDKREERINNSPYTMEIIIPNNVLKTLCTDDFIRYMFQSSSFPIGAVLLAIFVITILLAILTPFSKQSKSKLISGFNNIYFEGKCILISLVISLECILTLGGISNLNYLSEFNKPREQVVDEVIKVTQNPYFYFLGICYIFTFLLITYLCTTYFKYLYYNGIINGFFKKTIIGALYFYCYYKIKNILLIDYSENYKESKNKIIKILILNGILLFFIGRILGIRHKILLLILLAVYNYMIFKKLVEFLKNIEELDNVTSELAKGNFNTQIEPKGILCKISENLNRISKAFKEAVDKEVKSQNLKTQLISNVSHDLKTPLTSIINYSDLIQNENNTREQEKEYAKIIHSKSQRLKILIEDLFEASKATSGDIEMHLEELDVISLLRQTLGELNEKIIESNIEFVINLPDYKVMSKIDGLRTYRVFANILSNIFKYTLLNTRVYIDYEDSKDYLKISFKNIANYKMDFDSEIITQRFQRGEKSRSVEGSGLGLAIAKSLMELQNGQINIKKDADLFTIETVFTKK